MTLTTSEGWWQLFTQLVAGLNLFTTPANGIFLRVYSTLRVTARKAFVSVTS
jgi:hypothetical protein